VFEGVKSYIVEIFLIVSVVIGMVKLVIIEWRSLIEICSPRKQHLRVHERCRGGSDPLPGEGVGCTRDCGQYRRTWRDRDRFQRRHGPRQSRNQQNESLT
jgi:hypothetical protein